MCPEKGEKQSGADSADLESIRQSLGQDHAPSVSQHSRGQICLPQKSHYILLLLAAVLSPKLPICTQNVIFIIILRNFRIATVQRATQLPVFSLILGHRQNMPGMN